MNDTPRTYPRSLRDAFREWPENALGIDGPAIDAPIGLARLWADFVEFLRLPSPF